jgi:DNA-binding NarL/FixJ family response regulator
MSVMPLQPVATEAVPTHTVLVVDDDDRIRESLADLIDEHPALQLVATTGSVAEALQHVQACKPDIVVLDYGLPDEDGEVLALRARELLGSVTLVVYSAAVDTATVTRMLRAGATGYLAKGEEVGDFGDTLLRVARGHVVIAVPGAARVFPRLLP